MACSKSENTGQFRPNQVNSKTVTKRKTAPPTKMLFNNEPPANGLPGFRLVPSQQASSATEMAKKWMTAVSLHASMTAAQKPATTVDEREFVLSARQPERINPSVAATNKVSWMK